MAAGVRQLYRTLLVFLVIAGGSTAVAEPSASIVLRWEPVEGASEYELEIAHDAAFADVAVRARVSVPAYRWREIPAAIYFWRVRSLDGETRSSPWSEARQIRPASRTPAMITPNGQRITCAPHCDVELRFERNPVMKRYLIAVSSTSEIGPDIVPRSVTAASARVRLQEPGTWYWRVRGVDFSGRETEWSEARSVIAVAAPPAIISPPDGASFADAAGAPPPIALTWSAEGPTVSYELEIRDPAGALSRAVSAGATHAYAPPAVGTFNWRVRAGAEGEWTTWHAFHVLPTAPQLAAPAPSARISTRKPEVEVAFEWHVGGPAPHRLEISRSEEFAEGTLTQRTLESSAIVSLPPGHYVWRVVADAGADLQSASAVRALTVVARAPLTRPISTHPARDGIVRDTRVAFAWTAVPFAVRYELSVHRSHATDAAQTVPAGGPHASLEIAEEGEYDWRVRGIDEDGTAGPWSEGTRFQRGVLPASRAVLRPGPRWNIDAGSDPVPFEVQLYDSRDRPVEGAMLAAATDLGLVLPIGPSERGTYRFAFLPPEHVAETTVAEIQIGDRHVATRAQVDVRPPRRFRLSARAGFGTNFGALAGPWVGADVAMKAPMVRRAWIVGRLGTFGGEVKIPTEAGLDVPMRGVGRISTASVLAAYEWSAPLGTLQVGAGPALHLAQIEMNQESEGLWGAGLELTLGAARRWGPGKALVQASLGFGASDGALARLRTGSLVLSVGYGWEP